MVNVIRLLNSIHNFFILTVCNLHSKSVLGHFNPVHGSKVEYLSKIIRIKKIKAESRMIFNDHGQTAVMIRQ